MKSLPQNQLRATYDDYRDALCWTQELIASDDAALRDWQADADEAGSSILTTMITSFLESLDLSQFDFLSYEGPLESILSLDGYADARRAHAWILHREGNVLEEGPLRRIATGDTVEWCYGVKYAQTLLATDAVVHIMLIGAKLNRAA